MKTDTIFRIASMTKPVTSVAIMMLFEEGKLFLTDPVSKFIPAFKSSGDGGDGAERAVPARRAITIRDLLVASVGDLLRIPQRRRGRRRLSQGRRHRWVDDDDDDAAGGHRQARRTTARWRSPERRGTTASPPTCSARVVEVVSGKPFNVFLRDRIFKPLEHDRHRFRSCPMRSGRASPRSTRPTARAASGR